MVKFDEPLYVDPDGRNVMVGGKPAEQRISDLEAGIARVGGFWRHPNYFEAYRYSASVLIEQGRASGSLDEVGLPSFYLLRHATELLLKDLLRWLVNISDLRNKLGRSQHKPSTELEAALRRSHDLQKLYGHLCSLASELNVSLPPSALGDLIADMGRIEITDTWSRYSSSSAKGEQIKHIPKAVVIPIVDFQERLEEIANLASAREAFGESYEDELHAIWAPLNAAFEQ